MKPETTEDILELMNGCIFSAVLGAAMELGIFWLLADKPLSAPELAQTLNIPLNRCHYWLQILCKLGLLADYFQQIQQDPIYTARFTRKLYQIHSSFAEQLAIMLDLRGVNRLLDLGGGSGVVSFALLRKRAELTSVVVDVESVCQAGRVIASENKLEKRITYLAAGPVYRRHVCYRRFCLPWNLRPSPLTISPRRWCKPNWEVRVFEIFLRPPYRTEIICPGISIGR